MKVNALEKIKKEIIKHYQKYKKTQYNLKKFVIGEDGSLFSNEIYESINEYGLSFLFNSALSLKYLYSDKMPNTGLSLTVEELLLYLKNAESTLRSKKRYADDLIENNPYNLEIIKNPSKNKVLKDTEYQDLLKGIRNSKKNDYLYSVLKKYNVSSQIIYKKDVLSKPTMFLVLARNIEYLEFIDPNSLTKREEDAFFGKKAKEILGINFKMEEKVKIKKL